MIYLDNAATTYVHPAVLEAMLPYLSDVCANPGAQHSAGRAARYAVDEAREDVAGELGCKPSEVVFTSGGSEADNQALRTAAAWGQAHGRTRIVSSQIEHPAILNTLSELMIEGFSVTLLAPSTEGVVSAEDIAQAMGPDVCAVSLMAVNNEIGTVQPFQEAARLAHEAGALFHTDAVQGAGHVAIDIEAMGIDMLSVSAHKFHGPKGVGALYLRRGIAIPNLLDGGGQERGHRAGTENVASIVGLGRAIELACDPAAIARKREHLTPLRDRIIAAALELPHTRLNGDPVKRLPGTINLSFEGVEGESLLLMLDLNGIAASSGSACTSGSLDPSHVLLALGLTHDVAHGSLRLSLAEDITEEEVDYIIETIPTVVARLRAMSPLWEKIVKAEQ